MTSRTTCVSVVGIDLDQLPDTNTQVPLHVAVRECYDGRLTQKQLAATLGVEQQTVSLWSTGKTEPRPPMQNRIEDACGRPHGWILRRAGFVDEVRTTEDAIQVDQRLTDDARTAVLRAYEAAVAASARRRGQ